MFPFSTKKCGLFFFLHLKSNIEEKLIKKSPVAVWWFAKVYKYNKKCCHLADKTKLLISLESVHYVSPRGVRDSAWSWSHCGTESQGPVLVLPSVRTQLNNLEIRFLKRVFFFFFVKVHGSQVFGVYVSLVMLRQMVAPHEALLTLAALEPFVACVCACVPLQLVAPREPLPAENPGADEGPLACVQPDVSAQ